MKDGWREYRGGARREERGDMRVELRRSNGRTRMPKQLVYLRLSVDK
jgi:hypothetical protein